MIVFREDRRPLAFRLRDELLHMLVDNTYQPNDQLPSEQELVDQFGVGRSTVREALKMLEEERLIYCLHGVGRFVAPQPTSLLQQDITHLTSITEMAAGLDIPIETRVLSLAEVPATEPVAKRLQIEPDEPVIRLERTRSASGKVAIFSIDVLPRALWQGELDPQKFEGSLLRVMEEEWGLELSYSKTTISAVTLERETSRRIGVPATTPWVLLEQVNYDAQHRPLLDSKDYHRGDQFQFHLLRRRRRGLG